MCYTSHSRFPSLITVNTTSGRQKSPSYAFSSVFLQRQLYVCSPFKRLVMALRPVSVLSWRFPPGTVCDDHLVKQGFPCKADWLYLPDCVSVFSSSLPSQVAEVRYNMCQWCMLVLGDEMLASLVSEVNDSPGCEGHFAAGKRFLCSALCPPAQTSSNLFSVLPFCPCIRSFMLCYWPDATILYQCTVYLCTNSMYEYMRALRYKMSVNVKWLGYGKWDCDEKQHLQQVQYHRKRYSTCWCLDSRDPAHCTFRQ